MVREMPVSPGDMAPELRICPHLGLQDDPDTQAAYPRVDHVCARRPNSDLPVSWQSQYCLQGQYHECPHFQDADQSKVSQARPPGVGSLSPRLALILFGLIGLLAAGATVIGVMLATSPTGT